MCGRWPSVLQCVLREQCGLSDMESGLVGGWRLPRGILRWLRDAMQPRKTSKDYPGGDSGVGQIRQWLTNQAYKKNMIQPKNNSSLYTALYCGVVEQTCRKCQQKCVVCCVLCTMCRVRYVAYDVKNFQWAVCCVVG